MPAAKSAIRKPVRGTLSRQGLCDEVHKPAKKSLTGNVRSRSHPDYTARGSHLPGGAPEQILEEEVKIEEESVSTSFVLEGQSLGEPPCVQVAGLARGSPRGQSWDAPGR